MATVTVGTLINFNNNFNWHYNLELAVHLAADGRLWHYNLELAVHLMTDVKFFSYICKRGQVVIHPLKTGCSALLRHIAAESEWSPGAVKVTSCFQTSCFPAVIRKRKEA